MESAMMPDRHSARRMAWFDALSPECREFLASYPRSVPADWAFDNWRILQPDLAEWRESVRLGFPVKG